MRLHSSHRPLWHCGAGPRASVAYEANPNPNPNPAPVKLQITRVHNLVSFAESLIPIIRDALIGAIS